MYKVPVVSLVWSWSVYVGKLLVLLPLCLVLMVSNYSREIASDESRGAFRRQ